MQEIQEQPFAVAWSTLSALELKCSRDCLEQGPRGDQLT